MTVTVKCKTKGCPFTPDEHEEWMALCRQAPNHGHRYDQLSHQHFPKKGMGGHNKNSKIVAILCWPMHDRIDNGDWSNDVRDLGMGHGETYFVLDLHGNMLIERPVLSDGAEAATSGSTSNTAEGVKAIADPTSPRGSEGAIKPDSVAAHTSAPSPSAGSLEEESDGRQGSADVDGNRANRGGLDRVGSASPLTHEQRVAIARTIKEVEWHRQWSAGDTANKWREEIGEEAEQYISDFGYVQESIANIMRVCAGIPTDIRHDALRYSHHVVVAQENREDMEMWLDKCAEEEWSVAEFRRQVKGTKPKVKRYSLEELLSKGEEFLNGYPEPPKSTYTEAIDFFLDWLGEQG